MLTKLDLFLLCQFLFLFLLVSHSASAWWLSAPTLFRRKPPTPSVQEKKYPLYEPQHSPSRTSSSTTSTSSSSKPKPASGLDRLPQPTKQDLAFQAWADRNGIFAPSVQCLTTYHSVGERGLFTMTAVQKGQVLASIPHDLILYSDHTRPHRDPDGAWAAHITEQILKLDRNDKRHDWIDAWSGGGCTCMEDAYNIAGGVEQLRQDDALFRDVRLRLARRVETWLHLANNDNYQLHEHDFPLYSLVYSRACFLGPTWGTRSSDGIGIVPLFDMLNHDGHGRENVKLVSTATAMAEMDKNAPKPDYLDDKDMLLIATKNMEPGTELLTEYFQENPGQLTLSRAQIQGRKLVQYGFL